MPTQDEPPSPRATVRRDALRNRQRIVEAAREAFHLRGRETTLDDVAAQAEVGVGTVYRNFPNKKALLEELFQDPLQQLLACATKASADTSAWDGVVALLQLLGELVAENPALAYEFAHADGGLEGVRAARDQLQAPVEQLIERAIAEERLRPDFAAADITHINTMLVALIRDPHQPRDLWRRYLGLIVDGMQVSRTMPTPLTITSHGADDVRGAEPAPARTTEVPPSQSQGR